MLHNLKSVIHDILNTIKREKMSNSIQCTDSLLFLTYRCTSRCKTCNMWQRKSASKEMEIDWPHWKKILQNLQKSGVKTVEIFGGDALLRKSVIFNMIQFCTDYGIDTYFPTNSILMNKETANKLVRAGLGTIYFSLDDVAEENDMIRGVSKTFAKVKLALESIVDVKGKSNKPSIIICTTLSNLNYSHFERVVDFLRNYPVSAVYPRPLGEFSNENIQSSVINNIIPNPYFVSTGESHLLNKKQISRLRKIVKQIKHNGDSNLPYINFRAVDMASDIAFNQGEYGITKCHCCTTLVVVAPNGDVLPCPFFPDYILGNLTKNKISQIWGKANTKHMDFIKAQQEGKIKICDNCNMRSYYPTLSETLIYYGKRLKEKLLHVF